MDIIEALEDEEEEETEDGTVDYEEDMSTKGTVITNQKYN